MEIRHLKYFVTVAEEMHFSRAAERLNITPPTLTNQIQALETTLGARLFTRKTSSGVSLTHFGKDFLVEARALVKQFEQVERVGRRAARGQAGSITVGYILAAVCSGVVVSSIVEFRNLYPDVFFDLRKMETVPQLKALVDGAIDIGFMRTPRVYPMELTGFVIGQHSLCLAIPEDHRLARHKIIEPKALEGEAFVTMHIEAEVAFSNSIMAVVSPNTPLCITARYPDAFSVLSGVAAGLGVAVLSEPLSRISIPGVVFRKINIPNKYVSHSVTFRKSENAPIVKAFLNMLRKKMAS